MSVVSFSFSTPSPVVLGSLVAGCKFDRVTVFIETPFDDDLATVSVGTSADPEMLLGTDEIASSVDGQYENDALVVVKVPDVLLLSIHPGSSTQGSGWLLYQELLP